MDFNFTEEQKLMAGSLRKAYEMNYDFNKRRAFLIDTVTFHSPGMWSTLGELGFIGILAPEADGGFGGGGADVMAVATEMSRHLSLEPFLSTSVMGMRLLFVAGSNSQKATILPGVLNAKDTLAVALYEPRQRYETAPTQMRAKYNGDGYTLNGCKAIVIGADSAEWVAVGASLEDGGTDIFWVDTTARGVRRNNYRLVDGRGAADLREPRFRRRDPDARGGPGGGAAKGLRSVLGA